MKQIAIVFLMAIVSLAYGQGSQTVEKKIFVYGGGVTREFIAYTAQLTAKEKPKICLIPTGKGDRDQYILNWYELCAELEVVPHVLRVWINSTDQQESWEEIVTDMDAIIVSGGNTLNMLAIWKAQKIDVALRKAYDKGIVLAGGSAGSLCWFNGGTTDSRPKELSIVTGLNFLEFSHCPHYNSEASRRPLYHKNILEGKLSDGYACDDESGILFVDGRAVKAVSTRDDHHSYHVYLKDGMVIEEKMESELIGTGDSWHR